MAEAAGALTVGSTAIAVSGGGGGEGATLSLTMSNQAREAAERESEQTAVQVC